MKLEVWARYDYGDPEWEENPCFLIDCNGLTSLDIMRQITKKLLLHDSGFVINSLQILTRKHESSSREYEYDNNLTHMVREELKTARFYVNAKIEHDETCDYLKLKAKYGSKENT